MKEVNKNISEDLKAKEVDRLVQPLADYKANYTNMISLYWELFKYTEIEFLNYEIKLLNEFYNYLKFYKSHSIKRYNQVEEFEAHYDINGKTNRQILDMDKNGHLSNITNLKLVWLKSNLRSAKLFIPTENIENAYAFTPIKINVSTNEIATILFNLLTDKKIDTTKENLNKIMCAIFRNKKNQPLLFILESIC